MSGLPAATQSQFKDTRARCHAAAAGLARTGLVPGEGGDLQILVQSLHRVAEEVGATAAM